MGADSPCLRTDSPCLCIDSPCLCTDVARVGQCELVRPIRRRPRRQEHIGESVFDVHQRSASKYPHLATVTALTLAGGIANLIHPRVIPDP